MDHNRKRIPISILVLLLIALSGCQFDLNVPNPNAPDRDRVLVTPQDVENMIGGTYLNYWQGTHYCCPSMTLSTMADELTSVYGSFGMKALSSEPRQAWDNSIRYSHDSVTWIPWSELYIAISMVTDGLKAIRDGFRIIDDNGIDNTARSLAFVKFVSGISHAWLGCFFDQGFILDENTDLEKDLILKPYRDLVNKGVELLEACITVCDTSKFELPDNWINGCPLDQDELRALAHSYIARFLVFKSRDTSERTIEDWECIKTHAHQGIKDDFFVKGNGDGIGTTKGWWSGLHFFSQMEGWVRADYKTIGPADTSGNYQTWLDASLSQRNNVIIHTPDLRLFSGSTEGVVDHTGTDFNYKNPCSFHPRNDSYFFSYYYHNRYSAHANSGGISPVPEFLAAEIDLILAEYYLRKGDGEQAAYYINKTRTTRGGLPPVSAADGIGDVSDERSIYGSLWATFMYEKGIELFCAYPGGAFFDRRGWGHLVKNTVIHFPIPARELEILGMDSYTFGGGGPGSAPKMLPSRDVLY